MRRRRMLLALAPLLFRAVTGHAVPTVTVDVVAADWTTVVMSPSSSTQYTLSDHDGIAGSEQITWGIPMPSGGEPSGYEFAATPTAFIPPPNGPFSLGDFVHSNSTLDPAGGALSEAVLTITAGLKVDGTPVALGPFTFSFLHHETENPAGDEAVFGSPGTATASFVWGGVNYVMRPLGFYRDGHLISSLYTPEGSIHTAQLMAEIAGPTLGDAGTPASTPEPGTLALLGSGLLGLVTFGRRRMGRGPEA